MKVKHRKIKPKIAKVVYAEPVVEIPEEDEGMRVDMTGWEDDFDYSDMRGLFFITKGQCGKDSPVVTVKNGKEYHECHVGSYDPDRGDTVNHYCVVDRITFHITYGGSNLDKAIDNIRRMVVLYNNDPEKYFRYVSEVTNEDFYFRYYENSSPFTDSQFKKRAEEGRSWKTSTKMKMHEYAILKTYGMVYEEAVEDAYEKAVDEIVNRTKRRRNKMRSVRKKRLKKH